MKLQAAFLPMLLTILFFLKKPPQLHRNCSLSFVLLLSAELKSFISWNIQKHFIQRVKKYTEPNRHLQDASVFGLGQTGSQSTCMLQGLPAAILEDRGRCTQIRAGFGLLLSMSLTRPSARWPQDLELGVTWHSKEYVCCLDSCAQRSSSRASVLCLPVFRARLVSYV